MTDPIHYIAYYGKARLVNIQWEELKVNERVKREWLKNQVEMEEKRLKLLQRVLNLRILESCVSYIISYVRICEKC